MDFAMREQQAQEILQSLIQGIDPISGQELASGTVLQRAEVLRALLAGVAALEEGAARAARKAHMPGNVGRPWSPQEQNELVSAFQSGEAVASIAQRHGRTLRAIEARLQGLGLLSPETRTTRDRFVAVQRG
jgi:hypothetical protein